MSEISDFDAFVKEREEKLNAPKQEYNLDYIPAEVVAYKNELNEQVAEVEHDTNYTALGGSIAAELGGGIYASHKLKAGKRYMNSLRNAKYAMNIFRGVQAANTATVGKSITPWGAAFQIGGYGLAEAGIWATSNFFGQQIRTAYGLQDDQSMSETMSAALFGVVAAPVEKVFEAGKLAQKAFKLSDGLVDLKAWKGREFMVNGTNKFISGSVLGLTESAFRQEIAIMLNEQESRDTYDYLLSGGIGGTLNSVIGMWAKTGSWGRQQEATMYNRVKKSVQEQIDEIDAQLTETTTLQTDRRALASKKRTLRLKRKELEQVIEITGEMETKTTQSSEVAAQQEVTPQGEPKQAPKLSLDENVTGAKEAPATPKETPEATPAPKETPDISNVPTEGITSAQVDDILNDFETVYQKAVADGEESVIAETLIDKTRRIYDNADFDMENIIDSIGKNPESITPDTLRNLIDKVDVQIKLLNGIYGRLNALGGRVVRMNRQDVSPTANSTFSQATELTSESLYQIKKRAEGMLGISGDDFIAEAQKFISKVDDTPPVTVKDDVVPTPKDAPEAPAKTEGIDSKETTDSVATVKTSLDKRIEKLQAQLESFYPNLGGKKLTAKQKGQKKKIDEDPKVKALKTSIARSKKYKKEADKIVELEEEAARLAKVAERDVPTEMADEVTGKKKPKTPALNPELDALKNQITAAKKLFRQRLKKIVDDENKFLQQQQNAELFEEIYSYVTREAEMEAIRPFFKGLRTVRMLRKLSMVNSITSAQAAIPTGLFELFKLIPRAGASKVLSLRKDDIGQRLALADVEAFFEGFKFLIDKKEAGQLFHHMRRTFKEGRDPNYNSATRFNDETLVSKNILPTGSARIMRDAAAKAREASIGQEATLRWAKERLKLGKFMDFMSLGARAIMATDAGFKRQLRFANARAEATKKSILADPTNPNFRQEADKILDSWTKDKGGLGILGDIEELADGNRYIDEALLMTSRTDNVQDVARNFTEELLIRPFTKLLNDDSTKKGVLFGTALEALMPFYSVGVRSVSRMAGLANPLRGLSKFTNPYDDIIRDLESKKGQFKILVKNRTRRGQTKEAGRAATQVRQLDERIRMAEGRRVNYNKEVLTDVLIQLSFGSVAFTAGYLGYATGTNSWMTADQKRNNPNKGAYQMFGIDYRAAVPVNLLMAMAADMGNYMRASQDGQLSKKMGNVQVMLNAVSNSMVDLPLAQGVKDVQNVFSENYDFEASVSEIVSSYVPIPSQAKKFVRKITSGEDLVDLRGGSFSDRMIYHVFGAAPPNRQVDILGQFKDSTKTWGHTINRFASSKEIEYQPYQERIASDHDGALAGRLPAGFDDIPRGQDMTNFVDEDGRTLHQHFALRLQETDIVERVNEFVTSSDFYDIYGLTVDDGEITKNVGLKAMQSMLNGYYLQVKAEMRSDTSFLSRFINTNDENLLELIENNKALQEIEYPKPL